MSARRYRNIPLWASRLAFTQRTVECILKALEDVKTTITSDELLQHLGIELQELDVASGETSASMQPFFMPRDDGKCQIANTAIIPDDEGQDEFAYHRSLRKKGIYVYMGLQTHLASAFRGYAYSLFKAGQPQLKWRLIIQGSRGQGRFRSRQSDAFSYYVTHGAQFNRDNKCHRHVWMESEDEPDPDRPMIAELVVLISWMLGAMRPQKLSKYVYHLPFHHVVPTMVISFHPRARVRVLYAYFDGTLKVQMTKHLEFDVPDYVTQMDTLLKWAWPKTCGHTVRILPMPTIDESDEDYIAVGEIEKPATQAKLFKRSWKKIISLAKNHPRDHSVAIVSR